MKIQRLLVALTVVNLGLLVFALAQIQRAAAAQDVTPCSAVARSRSLMNKGEFERASSCTQRELEGTACRQARRLRTGRRAWSGGCC